jgi:hypothetical protein
VKPIRPKRNVCPASTDPADAVAERLRHGYWLRIGAGRQRPSVRHFLDYCETGILQYYLSLETQPEMSLAQFRSRVGAILFERLMVDAHKNGVLAVRLQRTLRTAEPLLKKRAAPGRAELP